ESRSRRCVLAGDGASLAFLLFLGHGARKVVAPVLAVDAAWGDAVWDALIGSCAAIYLVRRSHLPGRRPLMVGALAACALVLTVAAMVRVPAARPAGALLLGATAEELVFRGVVEAALEQRWGRRWRARLEKP